MPTQQTRSAYPNMFLSETMVFMVAFCCCLLITVSSSQAQKTEGKDVCSLNFATGMCKASMPRWYFNKQSEKCETFIFGGCGGNGNNFGSKTECEIRCKPSTTKHPTIKYACSLNPATGHCKASMPRWFFNTRNGKCETFIFSGCGGNENRFASKAECEIRCKPLLQRLQTVKDVKTKPLFG